eukprot:3859628-Heterocapsa_arctica.AAC.1
MAIAGMPEDRSKTFKHLQQPSQAYAPVCVPLYPYTPTSRMILERQVEILPKHGFDGSGKGTMLCT